MATSVPGVPDKLGKARSCCFTLNNYNDTHKSILRGFANDCRYLVLGYEIAPTTGTPHIQGYISWENPRSLDKFKLLVSPSLHLERTRGTPAQAANYCKEDGNFEEFGKLPAQGERTDWCVALEQINSGSTIGEVVENQPQLLPCVKAIDFYMKNQNVKILNRLHRSVNVIILYGDAGSGKSKWAYENYPDLFPKSNTKWWDGYLGEKTILLEEYEQPYFTYTEFLKVLDRYPYQCEIKGGFVWAQYDTVIITANKPPEEWYQRGITPALARRINKMFFYSINAPPKEQAIQAKANPKGEAIQ